MRVIIIRLFDLHCDTLTRCVEENRGLRKNGFCIDLEFSDAFKKWYQVFALFIPDSARGLNAKSVYDRQVAVFKQALLSDGIPDNFSPILAVEGGAVLRGDADNIAELKKDNVKILTLCWNGENELGYGQSINKGLKNFGLEVVKQLEYNDIVIDVSHLSENGFYDVCKIANRPFIASHSNCRAITDVGRNLTDDQLLAVKEFGGIIGVNFYREFLSEESANTNDVVKHIRHLVDLGLENNVSIGSDFDGADMCDGINNVGDVIALRRIILEAGFTEKFCEKLFYENAYNFFCKYNNGTV